jgi:hypothetical protein
MLDAITISNQKLLVCETYLQANVGPRLVHFWAYLMPATHAQLSDC